MTYYQDEIKKMKYLRSRIASSLVMSGNYPDRGIIDKRLAAIDSKLALCQHRMVDIGDKFNVNAFNEEFQNIYHDLVILYDLVYEFSRKRFQETKAYVEMHLAELEQLAQRYSEKSKFETSATSIGKTVFFQSNGFKQTTQKFITSLSLGNLSASPGSSLSFFIDGRFFKPEDVTFYLDGNPCSPYSVNGDRLKVPGELTCKTYNCEYPSDMKKQGMYSLSNNAFTPNQSNQYIVYGGKNVIEDMAGGAPNFIKKSPSTPITLNAKLGRVTFYVLNGSYVNFDFSKKPLSQNFTGYNVQGMGKHHKITFEYEGPFSFDFVTDGTVYATKKRGVVKGDTLLYPDEDDLDSFLIEEYKANTAKSHSLSARIEQKGSSIPLVTMVAVKEAEALGEGFDD